jgi:hypothetical protein
MMLDCLTVGAVVIALVMIWVRWPQLPKRILDRPPNGGQVMGRYDDEPIMARKSLQTAARRHEFKERERWFEEDTSLIALGILIMVAVLTLGWLLGPALERGGY